VYVWFSFFHISLATDCRFCVVEKVELEMKLGCLIHSASSCRRERRYRNGTSWGFRRARDTSEIRKAPVQSLASNSRGRREGRLRFSPRCSSLGPVMTFFYIRSRRGSSRQVTTKKTKHPVAHLRNKNVDAHRTRTDSIPLFRTT